MIILFAWRMGDIETALCSLVVFLCELKGIQGGVTQLMSEESLGS